MKKTALAITLFAAIISVSAAKTMAQKIRLAEGSIEKVGNFQVEIGHVVEVGLNRPQDAEYLKKYRQNRMINESIERGFVGPMILISYQADKQVKVQEELVMREETHSGAQLLQAAPPSKSGKFEDVYAVDAHCPIGYQSTVWQLITADRMPISLLEIFVAPRSGVIEVYRLPLTEANLAEFHALQKQQVAKN